MNILVSYIIIINIISFIYMYLTVRMELFKLPEKANTTILIVLSLILGFIGVYVSRRMYDYEMDSKLFKRLLPLVIILELILIISLTNNPIKSYIIDSNILNYYKNGLDSNLNEIGDKLQDLDLNNIDNVVSSIENKSKTSNNIVNEVINNNVIQENITNEINTTTNIISNETD